MAQSAASEKLRPAIQIFAKYHFWMLAAIVPCVVVPALFMAQGHLLKQIKVVQDQINACISSLESVRKITQHPNPAWSDEIDTSTMRVKRETLAEWQRFWESQAFFRTWPDSLGSDFVKAVTTMKPEGKLSRKLLERYQDVVRSLVRELPARMGAEELMLPSGAMGESRPRAPAMGPGEPLAPGLPPGAFLPGGQGNQPLGPTYMLVWNQANQQQIYTTFDWEKAPTTTMVLMAQEELRVYGLLCDIISRMNKSATGPHNAAVAVVNELLVGYPAAADIPGGATGGRIRTPSQATGGMPMMGSSEPMGDPASGATGGKPAHPRFGTGSSSQTMAMSGDPSTDAAPASAGPTDEALRSWVYVDFNDHPLDAAALASAADAQMVHLMPFVMKLVMDQRQVDALLVELATAALPIDVRQLRINATASGPGGAAGMMMPQAMAASEPMSGMSGMPGSGAPSGGGRFYDLPVEIHGTIGLATQPTETAVGLEPGQGKEQPAKDGEKPADANKAAVIFSLRRRTPT